MYFNPQSAINICVRMTLHITNFNACHKDCGAANPRANLSGQLGETTVWDGCIAGGVDLRDELLDNGNVSTNWGEL